MGLINLGAGSLGPRCSVFSRLAGFGLQMWARVGEGHSSRCVQSEQEWLQAQLQHLGPGSLRPWGLGQWVSPLTPFPAPQPQPTGPRAKRDSGFPKTRTQESQSPKAYAPLLEPRDLPRVAQPGTDRSPIETRSLRSL